MQKHYQDLVRLAETEANADLVLLPTLIKEMIHYDLLYAITRTPDLARNLVFHGGTALRLCHASTRFSEDLDFCCGDEATFEKLEELVGKQFSELMESRYGLETRWDQKKPLHFSGGIEVRRWQARVYVPVPGSSRLNHSHRINVEVSRMPSHDNAPAGIRCHYKHLPPGQREMMIRTSSTKEILVDKILAVSNRADIKSRDLWDIDMLIAAETHLDPGIFSKRFSEPGAMGWDHRLEARIEEMLEPEQLKRCAAELGRFVRKEERSQLLDISSGHTQRLVERVATYLDRVQRDKGAQPMIGRRIVSARMPQGPSANF